MVLMPFGSKPAYIKAAAFCSDGSYPAWVHEGKNLFEIVAEDVQLLHNVNWEATMKAHKGLGDKSYLLLWSESVTGMSPDVFYANQHLSNDPEFAEGQA